MNQENPKSIRNHSLDLLRIIAMFMILTVHFFGWGGAVNVLTLSDKNYYIVMPVYFVSQIGNTLFFLLSGYFSGEKLRIKRLIFLERKTAFYAVVISVIAILSGINSELSWGFVIKSEFPVLLNRYWFISVYVILSLIAPLLVRGLNQCSKRIILVVIIAILLNNTFLFEADMTLLQGLHAFVIGYYLKKYSPFERRGKISTFLLFLGSVVLYAGERIAVQHFGYEHTRLDEGLRYTLILIMASLFLLFFTKVNIRNSFPSAISGNVLAGYLITACPAIYHQLYGSWLHVEAFCREWWFIGYYLLCNAVLFAVCVLIDKLVGKANNAEVKIWIKILNKLKIVKES